MTTRLPKIVRVTAKQGVALASGRAAGAAANRKKAQSIHDRVVAVIDEMRATRTPMTNAEIHRRAGVNENYLYQHHDLKHLAAEARAEIAGSQTEVEAARHAGLEAVLVAENAQLMARVRQLTEQLSAVQEALIAARTEGMRPDVISPEINSVHLLQEDLADKIAEIQSLTTQRDTMRIEKRRAEIERDDAQDALAECERSLAQALDRLQLSGLAEAST